MSGMRSHRSKNQEAFLVLLVLVIGGPIALINWFVDLPIASQVSVALGGAGVLVLIGYVVWVTLEERERKRRKYQQALLEFRWRKDMSPIEFERCCADYLGLNGWEAETTKGSGDQGADVVARKGGHLLVVQCKKYGKPIGNRAVQEVIAARVYGQATAAAVVSNQTYTPAARQLAEKASVLLLHFTELGNLDRLLGIFESPREAARLKEDEVPTQQTLLQDSRIAPDHAGPILYGEIQHRPPADAPPEQSRVIRSCPGCGTNMRLPTGRSGMVRCPACKELYSART